MSMHAARRVALVAALACAAFTAAPAHASAPAWATPATLSSQGGVKASAIAAGPDGQALAVFQDPQGLRASFRAPGGDWGAAETVTPDPASADRQLSDAVFLPDGRALVAYGDGGTAALMVAERSTSGTWTTRRVDDTTSASDGHPSFAIDALGDVTLVWSGFNQLHAAHRPAGGDWGATEIVAAGGSNASSIDAAVGQAGAVLVAYRGVSNFSDVNVIRRSPGVLGTWGTPQPLATDGQNVAIAADPAGDTLLVYGAFDFDGSAFDGRIYGASRTAGGAFGAPQQVSEPGTKAWEAPAVGMDGAGNALVGWMTGRSLADAAAVFTRGWSRGGGYGAVVQRRARAVDADSIDRGFESLQLDVNRDGDAVLAYGYDDHLSDDDGVGEKTEVLVRRAGAWSETDLARNQYLGSRPLAAVAPDGTAAVIWESFSAPLTGVVKGSAVDPARRCLTDT